MAMATTNQSNDVRSAPRHQKVSLAGSTGSIGTQTLDVITSEPERFSLEALGATGRKPDVVIEQVQKFRPAVVAINDPVNGKLIAEKIDSSIDVRLGEGAIESLGECGDVVVNGVVGFAGLSVTLSALLAGKRLALANKESLIAAGPVVQKARRTAGAELVPIDSEHGAIHQCLRSTSHRNNVSRLLLTASGGPFRGKSADELSAVTIDDALAHPTWSMGPKITIDSSTLMNKGLEVIEANELFGRPAGNDGYGIDFDTIEVVVHPQSIIHSMVEFTDGSTIAQLSLPDMRLPIGYALAYPERIGTPFGKIDWSSLRQLDFEPPDFAAFPCLGLAYEAGRAGGTAPAWLNAANEIAVAAFLDGRIAWRSIPVVISETLQDYDGLQPQNSADVIYADTCARKVAANVVAQMEEAAQ